ncbi:hypothetical protein PHET_02256 [Paragonimus heterotremus]|uniref:Uncharacterized protein n=1 Tax=Paragonimus heterotremus TaxID=100268 RepID=A0A8J4WJV5_9TREM|nr:hypothetical protein PHET_02256 [Paragonimus heterotremus]
MDAKTNWKWVLLQTEYMYITIFGARSGNVQIQDNLLTSPPNDTLFFFSLSLPVFASMSIVFAVYRALQVVSIGVQLGQIAPYTASRISFYIVQTIFLLLLHRLVVLAKVLWFRFLLLHLLTVNLCIWMDSAIEKVSKTADFPHESDANQTILPKHHPAVKATNYCLPAVSEYCAIAAAIIYEMTLRIGQVKQIQNTSRVCAS